jgi:hypothetical protein
MKKTIITEKIARQLNSGIKSEAEVVYLLAEIKKVLEIENRNNYYILSFFRDWVLHKELSRQNSIKKIENRFDSHISFTSNSKVIGNNILSDQKNFFNLELLRNEFRTFLEQHDIPKNLTDSKQIWIEFSKLLFEVLEECHILINGTKMNSLSIIQDASGNVTYRIHLKQKLSDNKNIIKVKIKFPQLPHP